ncbi:hypothetical protein ACFCV9_37185 [Streptomyces sp. NPDC056367]|uniref:hypothetical protein n=1 Tax=Streptomyces sp. NPDC056367 TaxID=3345797 RepID=UPI0035E322BE
MTTRRGTSLLLLIGGLLGTAGFAALSGLGAALLAGYAVVAVLILNRFGPALAG